MATFVAIAGWLWFWAAPAGAAPRSAAQGGGFTPAKPAIASVACATQDGHGCFAKRRVQPNGEVRLRGANFEAGASVTFLGSMETQADDVVVPASVRGSTMLRSPVPAGSASGPLVVTNPNALASNPSSRIEVRPLEEREYRGRPTIQAFAASRRKLVPSSKRAVIATFQVQPGSVGAGVAKVEAIRLSDMAVVRVWEMAEVPMGVPASATWDGTGPDGAPVPAGLYVFRLKVTDTAKGTSSWRYSANRNARRRALRMIGAQGPGVGIVTPPRGVVEVVGSTISTDGAVFPIGGKFDLDGFGAGGRFGAQRTGHMHQGHDIPAPCGEPLVAIQSGTVKWSSYQAAAGNYVVISTSAADFAYMHLRDPALVKKGDAVSAGQLIGYNGETGNADGCHVHFEMWVGGGWYGGGHAIDPYPYLKSLAGR